MDPGPGSLDPMSDQEDLKRAVTAVVNDCLRRPRGRGGARGRQPGDARARRAPARRGRPGRRRRGAGADGRARDPRGRAARAGRRGDGGRRRRPRARPCSRSRTPPSRKAASEAGARIATLPGVTEAMLARVMSADMAGAAPHGRRVADLLDARHRGADHLRRTAPTSGSGSRDRDRDPRRRRARARPAPSATCPAARASSPRSRAPAKARWSSTARSPGSASRPSRCGADRRATAG